MDGASGPAVRGSTRTDCSTGKPSGARLVISSARRGHAAANRASSAPASSRYSKPSRTSSSSRGRRCINSRSRVLPFDSRMPSARAIVAATSRWSRTGARSTKNTPSGKLVCAAAATVKASRVLPTPLGPVRVTRRPSPPSCLRRFATSVVSCSRPTSGVAGTGSCAASPDDRLAVRVPLALLWAAADRRKSRSVGVSPSALASSARVDGRGVVRRPRSSAATASTLSPARSASCSCENPAANRNRRSSPPNTPGWTPYTRLPAEVIAPRGLWKQS